MATPLTLDLYVNGDLTTVTVADDTEPLLYVLRNQVGTQGVKFGCGVAQCGACTVIVDGVTKRSCVTPLKTVANGAQVTTLEGLGQPNNPKGIQKAFIDNQAAQCAYCMNGMIMVAKVLLDKNPHPTDDQIKQALNGNLCRCGSHLRVIRAVKRAASVKA